MEIIDCFLEEYSKKYDYYTEAGRIIARVCETHMEQMGIRTIVTSRAKKLERLRNKLEKRSLSKKYEKVEDIFKDIADLSGIRIALYFPGDLYKVQQFIESNFRVKERKTFPEPLEDMGQFKNGYKKRFSGYWAVHYRVYLKEEDLSEELKRYANTLVEIQVASALMHAWAEVEHDLVYKPFSGELSYEEYQILDELNGLVLAGEIALQRLQRAVKDRVSQSGIEFNNHYEVAAFLHNKFGNGLEGSGEEIVLGRVDLLFKSIKYSEFNKPERINEVVVFVDPKRTDRTIVDQIMNKISELDPEIYEKYQSIKLSEDLKYQMETLQLNRENGNRQGEANTLANIGYLYNARENYEEAIYYFIQAIEINREIGGKQGEANQLLNLGSTYRLKGEAQKALEYCVLALKLHKEISYQQGQANAMSIIGNIYSDLDMYGQASEYYEKALDIYQETNYRVGEINQFNNLGILYIKQKKQNKALDCFHKALDLCKECEYKQGEGEAFHNIGNVYFEDNILKEALYYYEKALHIQNLGGNQKNKIGILISIGKAYEGMQDMEKALTYYEEALLISKTTGNKNKEEKVIRNIDKIRELI